jgi:PAS domain S-box-containing protein
MWEPVAGGPSEQARLILDSAPDAFVAVDPTGRITEWNASAERLFGWTREEAVGRTLLETVVPPDEQASHLRLLAGFRAAGQTPGMREVRAVHRDGHEMRVELAVGVLPGSEGRALYAFIRDVSNRVDEADLERRERRLSELLAQSNVGSWSWDIASNQMTWSDELYVIHGLEPGTALTFDTYLDHVHPDDRPHVEAAIDQAMRDRKPFEYEHRIVRADGSVRWVRWQGMVPPAGDRRKRLSGTAEDVTDRNQAERLQSLLVAIVESTDDAIKSMATDGTIMSWNAAAHQLYGYRDREILGRSVLELFPNDGRDDARAVLRRVIEDGRDERIEMKQRRKDGTIIDVAATLSPIRVGGKIVGVSAVSRNITARKRAERALQFALEREQDTVRNLQELDRMRNDFISDVSHELRTPLTSISGYAELLRKRAFGEINAEQDDALDVIARNTKRLLDLIEDIMALSRMESGVYSLELEQTDLRELVVAAGDAIASAAAAKSIELIMEVAPDIGTAMVDPVQLDRAFLNVLSNAVKFTSPGGHVRLSATRAGGDVVIAVTDDGIGIDDDDQKQVFKRFFRSVNATRSAIQGTGLGLVITKTIVEHHNGTISLESEPGKGTTVRIQIPAVASDKRIAV